MEPRAPRGGSDAYDRRGFQPPLPWSPPGDAQDPRSVAPAGRDDADVEGPGFREPRLEFRTDVPEETGGGRGGDGRSSRARHGALRWILVAAALLVVSALCAG